jgi:hypothetical protein
MAAFLRNCEQIAWVQFLTLGQGQTHISQVSCVAVFHHQTWVSAVGCIDAKKFDDVLVLDTYALFHNSS